LPAVLVALFLTATTGYSFTALYVFGDSLSDTGRNPPAAGTNYYEGRWSNGPLWVEYLSADLRIPYNYSNNFAVSGSTTSNLLSQIAGLTPSPNLQSGLFTLISGGNDFLYASESLGENDSLWDIVMTNAVMNLTNAISAIYTNGGRELIVANLVNVGLTPAFLTSPPGYATYVDGKVALFNMLFATALTNVLQYSPGLRLYFFDDNLAFSNFLSSAATYGFTDTTNGTLEDTNLLNKSFNGPGADYLFWDTVHPTTKAHALIAAIAYEFVAAQLNLARSGTNFSLNISNLYPTMSYTIQGSTNLTTWTNYQTITATTTNATLVLTNKPGTKAFYRVLY
jgi:phospholipase/lecithinase/hemolysin